MTPLCLTLMIAAAGPYILAVGVNDPGQQNLLPLHYADDDAAEAALLFGSTSNSWLHTIMDAQSQNHYAQLQKQAHPPTLPEIERSVAVMAQRIQQDRTQGDLPNVVIWLSGHAAYDKQGHAYFPLTQGRLTASSLIDQVIRPLQSAHRIHLIVDTCFAEALVRSRVAVKRVSAETARTGFARQGIQAFSNVGALFGSSAGARGYEWQEIRSGVFSAMVRAGLRGAADANRDSRVVYSELIAFLAAASQAVEVEQARPTLRTIRPAIERDATICHKKWLGRVSVLRQNLAQLGTVHVLDHRGAWLLAGAFEENHTPTLWLPQGRQLYLRAQDQEHPLIEKNGQLRLGDPVAVDTQNRSLLSTAFRQGLFRTPYGPAFYRGYNSADSTRVDGENALPPINTAHQELSQAQVICFAMAAVTTGIAVVAGALATFFLVQYSNTHLEKPAQQAQEQLILFATISGGALVTSALLLGAGFLFAD